jgi:hypothetical protein
LSLPMVSRLTASSGMYFAMSKLRSPVWSGKGQGLGQK